MRDSEKIRAELLVIKCRRGDVSAYEELVATWEQRLYYYIRRLGVGTEEAWDVLQDTWMKVFEGIGHLREPATFTVWLYRIARNTAVSRLRTTGRETVFDDPGAVDRIPGDSADTAEYTADADQVHRCLDRLNPEHREALTLFYLEDMSISGMAAVTGVPEGTVKSRLHFARQAMRSLLEKEGTHHG